MDQVYEEELSLRSVPANNRRSKATKDHEGDRMAQSGRIMEEEGNRSFLGDQFHYDG